MLIQLVVNSCAWSVNLMSIATISIKNLRLRTYIGFNEEEKTKKQDVVVNITLKYDASDASESDSVADAFNYKILTKRVINLVESSSYDLLEKMVAEIINIIKEFEEIEHAVVKIDKPHALRFADSVSVEMSYDKGKIEFWILNFEFWILNQESRIKNSKLKIKN